MLPEDFLWLRLPEERRATCDLCPKVITDEYRADCRCCTYFPHIPNFMLGLGLIDPDSAPGMQRIIDGGHALPEGTLITPGRLVKTTDLYSRERFGRTPELICPVIIPETGYCGIYPYRNSICATFFCETDHGNSGTEYWDKVQWLVGQVETALAQWCMTEVGLDITDYIAKLDDMASDLEKLTDPQNGGWTRFARTRLFESFFGREPEFFTRCAECVMDNRNDLYDIACAQQLRVAFKYERTVEGQLPEDQLAEIQTLPKNPGRPVRVSDLWYQLQLANRQLWEIPYNEAYVTLHPNVAIQENPRNDPLSMVYKDKPLYLVVPLQESGILNVRLFLSREEAAVLAIFKERQVIGEALLEREEMAALDDARVFLAECLRRNILLAEPLKD